MLTLEEFRRLRDTVGTREALRPRCATRAEFDAIVSSFARGRGLSKTERTIAMHTYRVGKRLFVITENRNGFVANGNTVATLSEAERLLVEQITRETGP